MKHFTNIADLSPEQILNLLDQALSLKAQQKAGENTPLLAGKTLAMVFQKPSLRTRVSFDVGMYQLGGYALYISPAEVGLGQRESVADVARVLSGYVDGIMARTFEHQHILELAEYASVPVINGLSDYNHPCQAMADLLTILECKKTLTGLTLSYVGDGNNVARSLLFSAVKVGINVNLVTPKAYALPNEDIAIAQDMAASNAVTIRVTDNPQEGVAGADVIYTDVWTSMGQEAESQQRLAVFPPYQLNQALISHAKSDVIVLHCLPAHRGEEITDAVADGPHSRMFQQAENRLHAQKAILVSLMA